MTIIYPKEGKQIFPKDAIIVHSDDDVALSQLEDTFILQVLHRDGEANLNYEGFHGKSIHKIYTSIDTDYHSKNLEFLIDVFSKYEEIWQSK